MGLTDSKYQLSSPCLIGFLTSLCRLTAGSSTDFVIVARDAKGIRKSLGGDVFKVSWTNLDGSETPMIGRVRPSTIAAPL